jgi:hypothetical protein
MRLRRRQPEQRNEQQHEDEFREAEQYDFDDARHFAGGSSGQSDFARRGLSHEERMRDDDSSRQFQSGYRPREREGYDRGRDDSAERRDDRGLREREGYYGSGGSYSYGGGFEHDRRDPRERRVGEQPEHYRSGGELGPGNEEFYEATGGFGYDTSAYGRQGFGYPGSGEQRRGVPSGGHRQDGRGHYDEQARQPRGVSREDARQGYTQTAGYWQSGGDRLESGSGYGRSSDHADARGHEGGGRGSHAGPRYAPRTSGSSGGAPSRTPRPPKGYARSDERIHEDVCDRLGGLHADVSEVSVTVASGVVTLEGTIKSRHEKFFVEEAAASVMGVQDVENRLRIARDNEQRTEQTQKESAKEGQSATQGGKGPGVNGLRG